MILLFLKDTEIVAKLTKYIFDSQKEKVSFTVLVKQVLKELEGSFAFIFKSNKHYPNEVVATRRGSPLIVGVKTAKKLKVDFVDVEFGNPSEAHARKSYVLSSMISMLLLTTQTWCSLC